MSKDKVKEVKETEKEEMSEEDKVAKAIEDLIAENSDMKDKMLRTMSEMENLRKRTQKEMADTASYSIAKFAKEMLAVSDNLKRAMQAISEEDREKDSSLNNLFTGVEATESQLVKSFEKFGIEKVSSEGIFDANLHEVMMEQDSEKESGTILVVLEDGFTIGERLLRPARVIVAK